jgi:hypothetical protein
VDLLSFLFRVLFAIVVVGVLLLPSLALASALGGWRAIAKRLRTQEPWPADRRWFVNGSLGWVKYRSGLVLAHSERGLFLAVIPPYRPFHPRLFVPWSSIVQRKKSGVFVKLDSLIIQVDRLIELKLSPSTTEPFQAYLPPYS